MDFKASGRRPVACGSVALAHDAGDPSDDEPAPGDAAVEPVSALRDLNRVRRRNRAAEVDVFDGFYKAYALGVGCGIAVLLLSDAIGDLRADPHQVSQVTAQGAGVVGAVIAVVFAVALRSGSRGGPLVLPAAEVRHVLLAPVPRGGALRGPAIRQIRFSTFVGAVVGAGLGVLAARRLPGGIPGWIATGAGVGAVTGATASAIGLVACGRRVRPWVGLIGSGVLLAWSAADIALARVVSPMGLLGQLALVPLKFRPGALAILVVSAVLLAGGVRWIGGLSLEQAERRATLASQIRFALTLQDLRTVVLLRRQLTQEQSRARPWIRLKPLSGGRRLVWRRDVRGLTRWPAVRVGRIVVLGAVAGMALVGVWAGTTPLIVVAALALFLAGLEALEPLAQDIDHPDLPTSTPVPPGELRLSHIPVPFIVMVVVSLFGWGAVLVGAAAGAYSLHLALTVGPALILPGALLGVVGAATSVVMEPPAGGGDLLPAEIAGMKLLARAVWSPALVLIGLTPVLLARAALRNHQAPGPAAVSAGILPLMAGVLGLGWVRFREEIHEYFTMPAQPAKAEPAKATGD
jgi:hypothetical protein